MTDTKKTDSLITITRSVKGTQITLNMAPCTCSFVVYELIRALFFMFFVKKGFRSVSLKMKGPLLSTHCSCSEFLYVWQYVIVSLMPAALLGLLPLFYALLSGRYLFLLIGILFLLMGINDYKTVYLLRYFEQYHFVMRAE